MDRITALIGKQGDGLVFQLTSQSRERVQAQSTYQALPKSVFIAFDLRDDFEKIDESVYAHVLSTLTGLSFETMDAIGGYQIIDPLKNNVVYSSEYATKN
jgi:hypothetical protein